LKSPIIALVGLSGVGKSTFAKNLSSVVLVEICSASEIIKNTLEHSSKKKWTKEEMRLADTDTMQNALVNGFEKVCQSVDHPILIDAHTFIDKGDHYDLVKPSYFKKLGINMIVHLIEDSEIIVKRRAQDTNRTRPQRTDAELTTQQSRSFEQAVKISTSLGIECFQLKSTEYNKLANILYPELEKWR